jgi:glutamyl-tRNA synthetase
MQMLRALGAEPPVYAHLPMILGPDGAKLSKRHGAVSVLQFRDMGFLPEALLNYLARLGWSHGDQEIFTIEELVRLFDIEDCNKSASALNPDKMLWTNQQHMMRSSPEHLAGYLAPQLAALGVPAEQLADAGRLASVAKAQQERARTLKEMAESSLFFFNEVTAYEEKAAKKNLTAETAPLLEAAAARLEALPEWTAPAIHVAIDGVAKEQGVGLGKVAQPLRVAVSGGSVSPPIDVTLEILGRDLTLARLGRAIVAARP